MAKADDIEAEPADIRPVPTPADSGGRRRAERYLDLWERHLVLSALQGIGPAPRKGWTGG